MLRCWGSNQGQSHERQTPYSIFISPILQIVLLTTNASASLSRISGKICISCINSQLWFDFLKWLVYVNLCFRITHIMPLDWKLLQLTQLTSLIKLFCLETSACIHHCFWPFCKSFSSEKYWFGFVMQIILVEQHPETVFMHSEQTQSTSWKYAC